MTLKWHKSCSTIYPELLDETSSKTSVYIRKNVEEKEIEEPHITDENGDPVKQTVYEYDEAILTKSEYEIYKVETNAEQAIAELAEALLG